MRFLSCKYSEYKRWNKNCGLGTAGYRSLLFDFYSYFFYRPVNIKISVEKMSAELNQALPVFISGLDWRWRSPANLSASEDVYRRLYYLEYLCKLTERMLTDNRLNIMDYIIRYIEAFSHYEMNEPGEVEYSNKILVLIQTWLLNVR